MDNFQEHESDKQKVKTLLESGERISKRSVNLVIKIDDIEPYIKELINEGLDIKKRKCKIGRFYYDEYYLFADQVRPFDNEKWVNIKGFEDFEISNLGRIRSVKMKIYKHPGVNTIGYFVVYLRAPGKVKSTSLYLHRLMATAFIPNLEEKSEVNHINGIKNDCRLANLEWVTKSENAKHAHKLGLSCIPNKIEGERPNSKLTRNEVIDILKMSIICEINSKRIARAFDVDPTLIQLIYKGRIWKETYQSFMEIFNIKTA